MMKIYMSLIVAAIVAIVIYIMWIGSGGAYSMQTIFLVVPKDHVIAVQSSHVMDNILYIIDSSLPKNAHITHRENTGVFTLTVSGDRISAVQKDHTNIVQTISSNVKKYYHMPDDIVMYVVSNDAQPRKNSFMILMPYLLMTIIAIGAIAGVFAIFSLFDALRETRKDGHTQPMDGKKIFEKFHAKDFSTTDAMIDRDHMQERSRADQGSLLQDKHVNENNKNVVKDEKQKTMDTSQVRHEDPVPFVHTDSESLSVDIPEGFATIPGNLPVVDVARLGFASKNDAKADAVEHDIKEPTEEELKARLNQLLNGKL
jgi:hypothetical protein